MSAHTAQDVVDKARFWIGTPYRNQGRARGAETDCVGILIGVGAELGYDTSHEPKDYGIVPDSKKFLDRIRRYANFVSYHVEDARPGDLLLITWREQPIGLPHHAAICAEHRGYATMIHAHSIAGKCVEHRLTSEWASRVRAVYRLKRQEG